MSVVVQTQDAPREAQLQPHEGMNPDLPRTRKGLIKLDSFPKATPHLYLESKIGGQRDKRGCMCSRQERALHLGELGRKRSTMVPEVKDVVGIIFPGSQKALDGFWKSLLPL